MKYGTLIHLAAGGDMRENAMKAFQRVLNCGLNACQIVYKPKEFVLEDADVLRACAEECGIEISAFFCGYRDGCNVWDNRFDFQLQGINSPLFGGERIQYIISSIPFVKRLGVTDLITHAGFIPNNPFTDDYARMLAAVRIIALRCKSAGLNFLFETGGETPVAMLRLIQDVGLDNVFINFDTANLILYGNGNPVDALYTFGQYVRNTHMKDGLPPTDPVKLGKQVEIGQGYAHFEQLIPKLHELGYNRYMIIEREIADDRSEEEIMKSIVYLKSIVEKVYGEDADK